MKKSILYIVLITVLSFNVNCTEKKVVSEGEQDVSIKLNFENDTIEVSRKDFISSKLELIDLVNNDHVNKVSATGIIDVPPNGRAVISAQVGGIHQKFKTFNWRSS